MQEAQTLNPLSGTPSLLRSSFLGCIFIAALWMVSSRLGGMTPVAVGVFVLILGLPAMAAVWHQSTVRHLVRLHQFARGSSLRWLASRRLVSMMVLAALALLLTTVVLLQCVFLDPHEWLLLSVAPFAYAFLAAALSRLLTRQFALPVYGRRGVFWVTQGLVTVSLTGVWLWVHLELSEPPRVPVAETVLALQQLWSDSPSGIVRWGLDASAWLHAGIDALGWSLSLPHARLAVSLFVTPLAVFGFLSLTMSGLSLSLIEVRRTLAEPLSDAEAPPKVSPVRAAVLAAISTICILFFFKVITTVELHIRPQDSPFAVERLPECERIGGALYRVKTIKAIEVFVNEMRKSVNTQQVMACRSLDEIDAVAGKAVDDYLDWYFSLGAEWTRTVMLLAGGADAVLAAKFQELVLSDPAIRSRLAGIEDHFEQLSALTSAGRLGAAQVLERQRVVFTDQQCRVTRVLPADPATPVFDGVRSRLVTGSASGLLTGVIAAKITSKAMAMASMKVAGKVLLKTAAKKGATKAGAAMAGAAIGTVVGPGVGTLFGAAIGAGVGVAVGVSVDLVALAAEEKLTRPAMKLDLVRAVSEAMQPYRTAFACGT
jgi:hypothetical protein